MTNFYEHFLIKRLPIIKIMGDSAQKLPVFFRMGKLSLM